MPQLGKFLVLIYKELGHIVTSLSFYVHYISGILCFILLFSGKYLYVSGAKADRIGLWAIVKSPWAKAKETQCLSFAYYLTGTAAGLLTVEQTFRNETSVVSVDLY